MKKIYHLATCDTCKRIIKELGGLEGYEFQNIKEHNIEPDTLDMIAGKVGSYDALFSRRARKYRSLGLGEKDLSEKDIRGLILDEYTFLKRPVIISDEEIFVGNAPKEVARAKAFILGD